MKNEVKRLSDRFNALFERDGLINVKFFVKDPDTMKLSDFLTEVTKIQDTISAGSVRVVTCVDLDCEQRRFDAPF